MKAAIVADYPKCFQFFTNWVQIKLCLVWISGNWRFAILYLRIALQNYCAIQSKYSLEYLTSCLIDQFNLEKLLQVSCEAALGYTLTS